MDEETIERLVRIALDAEHTKIEDVSGGVHATFLVELDGGKEVVVSFCGKEKYLHRFEKEAEVMALVNRKSNVPVPEIIVTDFSQSKVEYPYYITKKVSGNNLESSYSSMSSSKQAKLAYKAGEILGELHNKVKFDSFGQLKLKNGELKLESADAWHSAFMDTMKKRLSELENSVFEDVIPDYINEFERNVGVLQGNFQPVLLHQDFRPANLMGEGTTITAVLDWEFALSGHNELDLFQAEKNFSDLHFDSEKKKQKIRSSLYYGYEQTNNLQKGWQDRRKVYRISYLIDSMKVASSWDKKKRQETGLTEQKLRKELEERIEKL